MEEINEHWLYDVLSHQLDDDGGEIMIILTPPDRVK